jgi:glycosyltransferase involved in cell wall biosynthesis
MPDTGAPGIGAGPDVGAPSTAKTLTVLALGMHWFAEGSGGMDRVFYDLVTGLPAYGIAVRALVEGPAGVASATDGVVSSYCPISDEARPLGRLGRVRGIRRRIGELVAGGGCDVIATHFALYPALATGRLGSLPHVTHFHGPWAAESRMEGEGGLATTAKFWMERPVYRRSSRVVVLSRAFGDLVQRRYGVDPARVRVIPGCVDLPRFAVRPDRMAARAQLGWPTDRPILLSVRRLASRMGLDRLIAAMPAIARAHPEVLLLIAGKGRLATALQQQTEALGMARHVRFLGFLPDADLPLAFRAADINVVPTIALEGFGLTAAEALAAGTPSMVTPVGGLPEVVAELSPDLVFASSGADEIAAGLSAALSGRLRLPDQAACAAYAAARFDPALAVARTAAVYRELA